jgi:hypothetical protein
MKNGPLDVSFIVDTSDTIGSLYLQQRLKPALKSLINYMYPGNEESLMISRMTIITLKDIPSIYWIETENGKKNKWYSAIDDIPFSGGGRATGDAFDNIFVVKDKLLRVNVPHVAILFSAGSQTSGMRCPFWQVEDLRIAGVKVFVVGLGTYSNE